jgi:hypothetical protein
MASPHDSIDQGDPWTDAIETLARDVLRVADRFVQADFFEPHMRPVAIRQALTRADEIAVERLAEGRVSRAD